MDDQQEEQDHQRVEDEGLRHANPPPSHRQKSRGDLSAAANRVARSSRKRKLQELPRVMGGLMALSEEN